MPKLAIYVPKKDMRQIEKWRKKINFSRVFMRALMSEIRARERLPNPSGQVAEAAAFYKQQLMQQGSDALDDQAFTLGYDRVIGCGLSSEAIRALLPLQEKEVWSSDDRHQIAAVMSDDQSKIFDAAEKQGFDAASRPAWEGSVVRAYVKGVAEAWRRVCEEMGSI